jgi:uncharacterized protein with beta-barrel porin domain
MSGGQSALKVSSLATKADATWGLAAFYGVVTDGATYAKTSLTIGYITTETERIVAAQKAAGAYDSVLYAARVEVGQRLDTKRVGVTPFLAVEPSLVARNGYTEKDASSIAPSIALGFGKSTVSAVPSTLGVKIDGSVNFRNIKMTPSASLGWVHNFAATSSITPFFTSLPGSTFTVAGAEGDRNLARTEFAIEASRGASQASVFASTRADFGQRTTSVRGAAGMMMRF